MKPTGAGNPKASLPRMRTDEDVGGQPVTITVSRNESGFRSHGIKYEPVVPAKAGTQYSAALQGLLDPRLRGDDT
jgi:hypothetical protein